MAIGTQPTPGYDSDGNVAGPDITENNLLALALAGQQFIYSSGSQQGPATAATLGLSIFNPATSGKKIVLTSLKMFYSNFAIFWLNQLTADPAYAGAGITQNAMLGNSQASVAHVTLNNTNIATVPGATLEGAQAAGNYSIIEMLDNDNVYILEPGTGLLIYFTSASTAAPWCITAKGVEF